MAITISMIEDKEFSIVPMGYKRKEVDEFLDEICDEMERMGDEIKSLQMKLSQAGQGGTQIYQNGRAGMGRPNVSVPAPLDIDSEPEKAPEAPAPAQPAPQPAQPVQAAPRQEPLRTDAASEATGLLRTAQRVYDETIRNAKEEARQILENAQAQVDEQLKLQKQEREATEEALQTLRQAGLDYKKKFQTLIAGQQKLLDDAGDIFTEG